MVEFRTTVAPVEEIEQAIFVDDDRDDIERKINRKIKGGTFDDDDYIIDVDITSERIIWPKGGTDIKVGGLEGEIVSYSQIDSQGREIDAIFDLSMKPNRPIGSDVSLPDECTVMSDGMVECSIVEGDQLSE